MMKAKNISLIIALLLAGITLWSSCSCNGKKNDKGKDTTGQVTAVKPLNTSFKGLYSFGPEVRSFQECGKNQEFWVTDSSAQLELQYSQLSFEKPYEAVYIIVEGNKIVSEGQGKAAGYDSTLVVKKLLKISRTIPQDSCR
jgi:copper homeostasis protein (lipoprotein)